MGGRGLTGEGHSQAMMPEDVQGQRLEVVHVDLEGGWEEAAGQGYLGAHDEDVGEGDEGVTAGHPLQVGEVPLTEEARGGEGVEEDAVVDDADQGGQQAQHPHEDHLPFLK